MNTLISVAIASSLMILISPYVAAQGDGVVTLGGEVVESACGLELASVNQTIEMPPEQIGVLLRNGVGVVQSFQLRLVNCSLTRPAPNRPGVNLPDWEHLRVTFDGPRDRGGMSFAVFGDSQGVALQIQDASGQESVPGVPMALMPLANSDMTLHYTFRMVGNGLPLVAGAHVAVVRFKVEYL